MAGRKRHLFALLAAGVAVFLLPIPAAAAPTVTTVTSGLDSPRGIAFFHGKLMVGEAGHGGSDCFSPPGAPPDVQLCIGATSRVSRVNSNGTHTPFVSGLFSVVTPEGEALGVSGLSASDDRLLVQIGLTPREVPSSNTLGQKQAGQLISIRPNGTWKAIAPVGAFDFDYTTTLPAPQEHDSNPYGVLASGDGAYVADAGSNTLDWVNEHGKIKIVAYDPFRTNPPTFPTDSVPTCVVRTEDGLLVGELAGRLLKVHGSTFTTIDLKDSAGNSLLSHVTGCTTDRQGNVYLVNMFGPGPVFTPPPASKFFIGNVVKYNPESGKASMLIDGLRLPNMDTVGPDGNLYVTIGAVCGPTPGPAGSPCAGLTGGVIKIVLPRNEEND
ncbi:MAG TPA: ScyD/ScyE family protein [Candidatus Limnocylindrales bacterium]|nr:ScyD/ScyE family protein [Candidatus Limnocylindrales bacterium]